MARSRDLVVLSAILLVPLAAALALQAPRTLHAWAAAQPRAPPTVA